ncbi:MAG: hypothetical protein MPN21_04730 [Thermoanaerobaculia bacterium]|nr:hypothetical protein [Thermoanaerobaculia bacterium]
MKRPCLHGLLCGIVLTCLATGVAPAQDLDGVEFGPSPVFRVNESTLGNQTEPDLGIAADGSVVVVWNHADQTIRARRLDPRLRPVGSEFQVSWITYGSRQPSVCVEPDGDFVAAWRRTSFDDRILVRRTVNGTLSPTGADEVANSNMSSDTRQDPAVDCIGGSQFVVVWRGKTTDDDDAIVGRRFVEGAAQDTEFRINTYTADPTDDAPDVGMDQFGDFVVVWGQTEFDSDPSPPFAVAGSGVEGGAGAYEGVAMRRFSSDGTALDGSQLQVFAHGGALYNINIDREDDGEFVVVWEDSTTNPATAKLELFSPQGIGLASNEFAPSGNFSGDVTALGVYAGPDDSFVVATTTPQGNQFEFQRLEDPLVTHGTPWNSAGPNGRELFAIAGRPDGSFVVAWNEYVAGQGQDVKVQQWIPAVIFSDGFESGNTSMWSSSAP